MDTQEIRGRTPDDLRFALGVMEEVLDVGEKVRVRLFCEELATEEETDQIYLGLVQLGEHTTYPVARIMEGVPTLEFELTKGSPALPVAVIPLIALFGILGVVVFSLVKIENITRALLPLALVVVSGAIVIAGFMRKPAERALVKYLPSTVKKVLAAS